MNKRFGWVKKWGEPQFFSERLKAFDSAKSKSIFIDSVSDIGCWCQEWFDKTLAAMEKNPQHAYIALTKNYIGLERLVKHSSGETRWRKQFHFGISVTTQAQMENACSNISINYFPTIEFFSIEPLLEPIELLRAPLLKLIIIGAETGNRKGKVIPQKEWVDNLVRQADAAGVSVFMKDSLRTIMGDDFRQDKLLWEVDK